MHKHGLIAGMLFAVAGACLAATDSSINATDKWAWSANVGWVNCRADVTNGAVFHKNYAEGYFYGPTAGWIHLGSGPTNQTTWKYSNTSTNDYGVNHDGQGNLSGYAWSPTCGWITFETNGSPRINLTNGILSGYAWSTTLGWLSFSNLNAKTRTDWVTEVYPTYTVTVSAGTNGTVSPSGTITVGYKGSTNILITPATYYDVSNVVVDAASAGTVTNYTFTAVTTNHTLAATFSAQLATNSTPKWWLASFGFTADFNAAALLDQDKDGVVTWQEFRDGSSPSRKGPDWWYTFNVVATNNPTTNDYAAINQGQLKWMAKMAYCAMTSQYSDVSASLTNQIVGFAVTNNFLPVTVGQLKNVASNFYGWLLSKSYATNYPWTTNTVADDKDYAPATIGQAKKAFNFNLPSP